MSMLFVGLGLGLAINGWWREDVWLALGGTTLMMVSLWFFLALRVMYGQSRSPLVLSAADLLRMQGRVTEDPEEKEPMGFRKEAP